MEGRDATTVASLPRSSSSSNDEPHLLTLQQVEKAASFHHHQIQNNEYDGHEEEEGEEQPQQYQQPNNNHNHSNNHHSYHHPLLEIQQKPLADQLKEKLALKNSGHHHHLHSINGCIIGRENGLTKLDRLDEPSIQPGVHGCNARSNSFISVKALPDNDDGDANDSRGGLGVVNCEKSDSTKDHDDDRDDGSFFPQVHAVLKKDEDAAAESSAPVVVQTCSVPSITPDGDIAYVGYESELQMPDIMRLIQKDLSEPYSIYTYRYFIHNWPKLCFLAMDEEKCVGAVVCKLDLHKNILRRGYIAMLAVDEKYRKRKIGSNLVLKAIRAMVADDADEVVLETEITNKPALRLYENLGFVRDKRLFRYYLNGVDALRLKLWLR